MYNHQLDTFIQVADLGSFNKAADKLFISAPAVLQQINLLEDICGFKLFNRTNHGVTLTPAGKSLYQDAQTIIRLSSDALLKAKRLAEQSDYTVRIGTSELFKCRLLPDIWSKISTICPDLKIEILPLHDPRDGENGLGTQYDIQEGIYASISMKGTRNFLELMKTPICCAVSKNHHLAGMKKLTMQDLNGEFLVMPIAHASAELDHFRDQIKEKYPTVQFIDSTYYGSDTFTLCELNPYVLITQSVYSDIHTNLITIPLDTDITLPYGLIYSTSPSNATVKFINAVKQLS